MKRTFLVRALLGAAIPMMMAEDVPAATQAAPEGGAPAGETPATSVQPPVDPNAGAPFEALAPVEREAGGAAAGEPVASPVPDVTGTDSLPAAQASSPADARSAPPSSIASESDSTVLQGTDALAVAPMGEPVAGAPSPISSDTTAKTSGSGTGAPAPDSSSSATTMLSTAMAPDTSSTAAPSALTTAALSSAAADATLADAGGISPTPALALDPALGQIPAPPSAPAEPAEPPADQADAAASPLMFEIHSVTENVPPIRIYADGHVDGLPAGYQLVINRGQAVAAELENLKADDRHLSLLASWHKEMEVLGRGLSGEVTRLLGETKKYLEDVL
ncbi:hypothetical protein EDD84_19020 [Burkholderia gladioli]|nr:hypothetical protein [Burkholderia gladioli]AYQ89243.1 hypothetical protein EDD84_19020 [Burkholderia gladioli]